MEKNNLNELQNKGVAYDCTIAQYSHTDEGGNDIYMDSYAIVWFINDEAIIAEPYYSLKNNEFYSRTVDFDVISIDKEEPFWASLK